MKIARILTATAALMALAVAPAMADREWLAPADRSPGGKVPVSPASPVAPGAQLRAQDEANDLTPAQARSLKAGSTGSSHVPTAPRSRSTRSSGTAATH
jgi:hypothetical protein